MHTQYLYIRSETVYQSKYILSKLMFGRVIVKVVKGKPKVGFWRMDLGDLGL